jgi:hypothetical protein
MIEWLTSARRTGFPSPLRGGVRGGGSPNHKCSATPPSLSLPHKGGGNDDGGVAP